MPVARSESRAMPGIDPRRLIPRMRGTLIVRLQSTPSTGNSWTVAENVELML